MTITRHSSAWLVALACTATVVTPPAVRAAAEEHAAKPAAGEAKTDRPLRPDVFDLGEFKIKNTLPTHHVTVQIQFAMELILSATPAWADIEGLEHWRQRLRDQAIIAIRSADPADFADPQLRRVRRLIMLRLRRLPTPATIIGLYLTDFAVDKAD